MSEPQNIIPSVSGLPNYYEGRDEMWEEEEEFSEDEEENGDDNGDDESDVESDVSDVESDVESDEDESDVESVESDSDEDERKLLEKEFGKFWSDPESPIPSPPPVTSEESLPSISVGEPLPFIPAVTSEETLPVISPPPVSGESSPPPSGEPLLPPSGEPIPPPSGEPIPPPSGEPIPSLPPSGEPIPSLPPSGEPISFILPSEEPEEEPEIFRTGHYGNYFVVQVPEAFADYTEYFANLWGKYHPDLGKFLKNSALLGEPGWVFFKRNEAQVLDVINRIQNGELLPPSLAPVPPAQEFAIDIHTAGELPIEYQDPNIKTVIHGAPTQPTFQAPPEVRRRRQTRPEPVQEQVPPPPSVLISATMPTIDQDQQLAQNFIQAGNQVNQTYTPELILGLDSNTFFQFTTIFGLPSQDSPELRQRVLRILEFLGALQKPASSVVDPDQQLAQAYLAAGNQVNQTYTQEVILGLDSNTFLQFTNLFGLPAQDIPENRRRVLRILEFLGALQKPATSSVVIVGEEVETPTQEIPSLPPAFGLGQVKTAPAPSVQEEIRPLRSLEELPAYDPLQKEPGEGQREYQDRIRYYQTLLQQNFNSSMADMYSRMKVNVKYLGVGYDPSTLNYLRAILPE